MSNFKLRLIFKIGVDRSFKFQSYIYSSRAFGKKNLKSTDNEGYRLQTVNAAMITYLHN